MGRSMEDSEEGIIELTPGTYWRDYPEAAISVLEEFLLTHPLSVRVKMHLASIYACDHGLGVAGAERLYREVLQDDSSNLAAMCGLALLHGHPHSSVSASESLALLERAVALSGDPDITRNLANKAWELGMRERALATFEALRAEASGPRERYFRRIADEAVRALERGERPSTFVYHCPQVNEAD